MVELSPEVIEMVIRSASVIAAGLALIAGIYSLVIAIYLVFT